MSKKHTSLATQLEILNANFYENFKFSEDLAKFLAPSHPKRIKLQHELNQMVEEMEKIRSELRINEN